MEAAAETAQGEGRQDAAAAVAHTSADEALARDRYHEAEAEARTQRDGEKP